MALSENAIVTTGSLRERKAHGSSGFPCAGYERELSGRPGEVMIWHRHQELETIYIKEGSAQLRFVSQHISLGKGELALVNSDTLHFVSTSEHCVLEIFVFSPLFIEGNRRSAIAVNYVEPVIHNRNYAGGVLKLSERILHAYEDAFEKLKKDETGYEIAVRNVLSDVVLSAYEACQPELSQKAVRHDRDSERIAVMLNYIHTHYKEDISLANICASASIGKREALRCFQRTISDSPMQYLLKYRLMNSADLLVHHPEKSIAWIAGSCGFSSPSYYTEKFHEFYQCTPKAFEKMNRKEAE